VVPPPLPNKCDWEVDPSELDFSSAARIGKVLPRILFISFARAVFVAFKWRISGYLFQNLFLVCKSTLCLV
jgi:hypothetical protein